MPRISPIITASWLAFGTLAIGILLPAPMTSKPIVGTLRRVPASVAVVRAAYVVGPSIAVAPDPGLARLNSLVWRHGQRPPQQASTSSLGSDKNNTAARMNANGLVVSSIQASLATQSGQQSPPPHDAALARMVATTAVNVHVSPGSGVKLFTLQQGESVEVVASQSPWVQVRTASGGSGWVYSNYLAPE